MPLKTLFIIVGLLIAGFSQAQTFDSEEKKYSANIILSPSNFPIPLSVGLNGFYKINDDWSVGGDILRSKLKIDVFGLDIGEAKETSFTIQAKRHLGESFNFKMGLGRRSTEILFGDSLLDLATANYDQTAAKFNATYIRLAMANVWAFKEDYRFEIDWLTIDVPFNAKVENSASIYAKSEDDAQTIEDAENILKWLPSGSIFKFSVGMVF